MTDEFRQAVRGGRPLLGTFIKTAAHQNVELIGRARFDLAVIDAEHAPFDRSDLDRLALAGRAAGLPTLVRAPGLDAAFVGQALDVGLAGVVAPHIDAPEKAEQLLRAGRFERGGRGFSPSTRSGGYGAADGRAYRAAADRAASFWCQIEDASALPHLDAIAAIEDIDCLFLGRADLALSLGAERNDDPKVQEAVRATAEAGRRHGRAVGVHIGAPEEIPPLRALGISVFLCASDQGLLLSEGSRIRREADALFAAPSA